MHGNPQFKAKIDLEEGCKKLGVKGVKRLLQKERKGERWGGRKGCKHFARDSTWVADGKRTRARRTGVGWRKRRSSRGLRCTNGERAQYGWQTFGGLAQENASFESGEEDGEGGVVVYEVVELRAGASLQEVGDGERMDKNTSQ